MGNIVGLIFLKQCDNQQAITDQFNVESVINIKQNSIQDKNCIVQHLIFNPLFECQVRYSLSEVMRQLGLHCLLYQRGLAEDEDPVSKRLATYEFVPVRCRRMYIIFDYRIKFPNDLRDGVAVPLPMQMSLSIITVPLIHEPRVISI